jgi:hypothetical protein
LIGVGVSGVLDDRAHVTTIGCFPLIIASTEVFLTSLINDI